MLVAIGRVKNAWWRCARLLSGNVDACGHAASAVGEDGAGVAVHGHDGGVSQKSVYEA